MTSLNHDFNVLKTIEGNENLKSIMTRDEVNKQLLFSLSVNVLLISQDIPCDRYHHSNSEIPAKENYGSTN